MRKVCLVFIIILIIFFFKVVDIYLINSSNKLSLVFGSYSRLASKNAEPTLYNFIYTQIKDGVISWKLVAEEARYNYINKYIWLFLPKLDYYSFNGIIFSIKGYKGRYNQYKQVVVLYDKVQGFLYRDLKFKSECLIYTEGDSIIQSNTWIILANLYFRVIGKGVVISFPKQYIKIQNYVTSIFFNQRVDNNLF